MTPTDREIDRFWPLTVVHERPCRERMPGVDYRGEARARRRGLQDCETKDGPVDNFDNVLFSRSM